PMREYHQADEKPETPTERRAEEELRQSEERFRLLVELCPDTLFIHSGGKNVYLNSAGAKLLGAGKPEENLGESVFDLGHPDYHAVVRERMRAMNGSGQGVPFVEQKFVRLDKTVVEVEVAAVPCAYQNQPAVQVIARDLSPRRSLERQIRQAQKMEVVGRLA